MDWKHGENTVNDARDRLLLSMSEALQMMLRSSPWNRKVCDQIAHNLEGCNKDLLAASGLFHGRPSDWQDHINTRRQDVSE